MNEFTTWHNEMIGGSVVEALKNNGFEAEYCADREEAVSRLLELIPETASVGCGGSWTIKQLGVADKLAERGNTMLDHGAPGLTNEQKNEIRKQQQICDVFLAGSNAVTMDGSLVNMDGTGNRVSAMIYGPDKVIIVAGTNKIVRDVAAAEERIRTKAAPINNKRIGSPNPCTRTGVCMDCEGPTRICNVLTVIKRKPGGTNFHVLIVGEDLGF
ncbi:MAG: lactate utilization protein [Synergistaceae bacterium]|nr:lactate utilization protein [Synergistota bacterium]NLM72350.1 lactate utilization protein [Synergistaceae bacterium]